MRVAENDDPTRRSDASPDAVDNWVHLPPAKRIDELGDFLEWLANAKPEDEQTIRAEINRYWGSVGDIQAVGTLNFMLSQVLKPGTTRNERQQILELIDNYSRYDPAEVAQFYDQLFDLFALLGAGLSSRPFPKRRRFRPKLSSRNGATCIIGRATCRYMETWAWASEEKHSIKFFATVRYTTYPEPLTTLSTECDQQ